jgi:hypothetical protein
MQLNTVRGGNVFFEKSAIKEFEMLNYFTEAQFKEARMRGSSHKCRPS